LYPETDTPRMVEPFRGSPHARSRDPLRVLAVVPGSGLGSSFIFVRRLFEHLPAYGIEVCPFYFEQRTTIRGFWLGWRGLRQEVHRFQPHVLHAQYGTVTAFLCAVACSVPLVITFRGSDLNGCSDEPKLKNRLSLLLSQLALFRAKATICVSSQLQARLWWRRAKATVLPSGVDLGLFRPGSRSEARVQLGWPDAERIVLFNRGGSPELKGYELARAAVETARTLVGDVRLLVVDGEVPPFDMPAYINAADCILVTSVREGSPNIVKEALACNVPVVSVDTGDVVERLRNVTPSAVVAGRDAGELGRQLAQVLGNRARSNGREAVAALSSEHIAKQLAGIYRSISRGQ
jgi:teichuronic acid biosynthesis glycosyltransferase TuaC